MNEFSGLPFWTTAAHLVFLVQCGFPPFGIVSEVGDDAVAFVHQRDAAMKIRDQHDIALDVNVRWKQEALNFA